MIVLPRRKRKQVGVATDLLDPTPVRDENGVLWCGRCRLHSIGNNAVREAAVCPSCKDRAVAL